MKNLAHFALGIFGNCIALFFFLIPVITFRRIIMNRSTEQFSGVPYVMTMLNCLTTAWYGLPFVSPHNLLLSTISGIGAAIESLYVLTYLIFASKDEKRKILGLLTLVLSVFAADVLVSLLALHDQNRKLFCGLVATIVSIIMYASPLTIIKLVIKTKSVEFMPFFFSFFIFLCGTSWFVFGLLGKDPFVAISNGLGCGLGTVQLILYAVYRDNKDATKKDAADVSLEIEQINVEALKQKQISTHQTPQDADV